MANSSWGPQTQAGKWDQTDERTTGKGGRKVKEMTNSSMDQEKPQAQRRRQTKEALAILSVD